MSTINPGSISDTSLANGRFEALGGQTSVDALHGREQGVAEFGFDTQVDGLQGSATAVPVDAGEDVLNASAWDDVADGNRLLSGDMGLEGSLGGMALSEAADSAADAVFSALF